MTSDSPQLQRALLGYRREGVREILAARESMFRFAQERAQSAEARVVELEAELRRTLDDLTAMSESAEAAQSRERGARVQLDEATKALQEHISRGAAADAKLDDLRSELAAVRNAAAEDADALQELAGVQRELLASKAALIAKSEQAGSAEARAFQLQVDLDATRSQLAKRSEGPDLSQSSPAQDLSEMLDAAERGVSGIMERARHAYEDQVAQAERTREAIEADIERFGDWQGSIEPLIRSVQHGIDRARVRIVEIPQQIAHAVDSMTDAMKSLRDSLDRLAAIPGPRSMGQSAITKGSADAEEALIQLREADPGGGVTVMPPSAVSRGEGEQVRNPPGHLDPGEDEDPNSPGHVTPWGFRRNHS
jgi:predicted  nucleic acid-binding Zn-ribbon protein